MFNYHTWLLKRLLSVVVPLSEQLSSVCPLLISEDNQSHSTGLLSLTLLLQTLVYLNCKPSALLAKEKLFGMQTIVLGIKSETARFAKLGAADKHLDNVNRG